MSQKMATFLKVISVKVYMTYTVNESTKNDLQNILSTLIDNTECQCCPLEKYIMFGRRNTFMQVSIEVSASETH